MKTKKSTIHRGAYDPASVINRVTTGLALAAAAKDDDKGGDIHAATVTALILSEDSRKLLANFGCNPKAIAEVVAFDPDRPDCDTDASFQLRSMLATYFNAGVLAASSVVPSTGGAR